MKMVYCIKVVQETHVGAKTALLRRYFIPANKRTSSARSLALLFGRGPSKGRSFFAGTCFQSARCMVQYYEK